MKKQIKLLFASAIFCLMLSFSALAGDTPISNLTDGDTPISNVTASDNSGPDDNSPYEFTKQLARDLVSYFLILQ